MVVYNGIDGEVALHAMFVARPGYFPQIVDSEGICRTGTHVQVLDTEIDGVAPACMAAARDSREPTGAMISKSLIECFIILFELEYAKVGFFLYFCGQIRLDYED